ncbi:MAG: HAMP domain-containing histidine kinase [Candidatus Adiutrix sp.]|jgi:signal transduction histidine kinase|nr:HAMP domain-containing histidine kinase [Candidatus Adiutrix sp.]
MTDAPSGENRKSPDCSAAARDPSGALGRAAYEFFYGMPLAAFFLRREEGLFAANRALAAAFGYEGPEIIEESLQRAEFLPAHFSADAVAQLYEQLAAGGGLAASWLMRGRDFHGRDLTLEISARAALRGSQGPAEILEAFFVPPGNVRDAEAFMQKAKKEAELVSRAKTEFLSNISHEFRTPLNIIIGMLDLAVEDESVAPELARNLALAKEAADGLFTIINDLIVLAHLEARRLTGDPSPFSANVLLRALVGQFSARAAAKEVALKIETDGRGDLVLEAGYNLIIRTMEKLLDNAIKFTEKGGEVLLKAEVGSPGDGPWLFLSVADNGPGLDPAILESGELFRQGDGSLTRKYGGLGLGLRLAASLVAALGGRLEINNRPQGGAEFRFGIPVKNSALDPEQD